MPDDKNTPDFIIVGDTPPNGNDQKPATPDPVKDKGEDSTIVLAADVLPEDIPLLPGAAKPVFPAMMFPIMLGSGPMAEQLKEVAKDAKNKVIGFVLAREEIDTEKTETLTKKLYRIGTAARLLNIEEAPDGSVRALMQGVRRFEILKASVAEGKVIGRVIYPQEPKPRTDDQIKALALAIVNTLRELMKNNPIFSEEIKMFLSRATWDDPGRLADFSVAITNAAAAELQDVLETLELVKRMEKALFLLRKELDLNELKEKITHQIEEKISTQQREFFLREQLKAIKQELGLEKDEKSSEIEKYQQRLAELKPSDEARARIEEEIQKLRLLAPESPEYGVSRNYLEWLTSLPWGKSTTDKLDVAAARGILDRDHYGLSDVKDRILEFIGVSKLRGTVQGSILCLVGPPGVGKTSLGRAVAEALGRKFYRFSLGGMQDEAEIKGHRRTYIGAMPGKLVQTLRYTATDNPVIMLDEIDKVGMSYRGDPASALLEVLDPEQNSGFLDHYLDVRFDLSKVLFIATANVPDTIPPALLDRMEVIRLSGYILDEKLAIAKRHLIPRLLPEHGLKGSDLRFTESGLKAIIGGYAREAGVRALEKAVRACMRKVAARKAEGKAEGRTTITSATVANLLGQPTFPEDALFKDRQPGVVMGLAWTPLGGSVLFIEAMGIPGKPGFKHTGHLGDVMQESASIALSFANSNGKSFNVPKDFFENHYIHLHVPAGATPKDGPSAGVTMATALISMATHQRLPARVAMTGELTLTGKVLPVGGIKEKMIAARRAGVTDVILPAGNERDFEEIPENVRKGLAPHFVEHYRELHPLVFQGGIESARRARNAAARTAAPVSGKARSKAGKTSAQSARQSRSTGKSRR